MSSVKRIALIAVLSLPLCTAEDSPIWLHSSSSSAAPDAPLSPTADPCCIEDPEELRFPPVLAGKTTRFSLKDEGRASNVVLVALRIQGVAIPPGESFSFNRTVGPRTEENGFREAPVIFAGEKVLGVGGGTCQVSSTLFAAAVMGRLEIVERRPHSRPVPYIGPGFDATVAFAGECPEGRQCYEADLVLRNRHPFPVVIRTSAKEISPGQGELSVWLEGGPAAWTTLTEVRTTRTDEFEKRERTIPWKKPGTRTRKQTGADGSWTSVRVEFFLPDGTSDVRAWRSSYKPVDEIWEIGPQAR